MNKIELLPGKRYRYQGHRVCIRRILDLQLVLAEYEATGALERLPISGLEPLPDEQGEQPPHPSGDMLSPATV